MDTLAKQDGDVPRLCLALNNKLPKGLSSIPIDDLAILVRRAKVHKLRLDFLGRLVAHIADVVVPSLARQTHARGHLEGWQSQRIREARLCRIPTSINHQKPVVRRVLQQTKQ